MERKRYYKVETSRSSYYAVIEHYSDLLHKVHFGGQKKCIVVSLYFDGEWPNIDAYSHHYKCNVSGDLLHGKGTVHMLKTAMRFITEMYPQFTQMPFQLKDQSYIPCAHEYELPLSQYYMVHYGKTWYETKFKAQPVQDQEKYAKAVAKFNSVLENAPMMKFSAFATRYKIHATYFHALEPLYNESKTMKEFFDKLKSYDCNVYKRWLELYVDHYVPGLYGKTWLLPPPQSSRKMLIHKLPKLPKDMFIYQHGGEIQKGDMIHFL